MLNTRRLKTLRKEKGFTQRTFAELIGENPGTYRNWEQGINNPNTEAVIRIADALDCSTDYLLGTSNTREREMPSDDQEPTFAHSRHAVLYKRMKNASDEQLDRLEKIWDMVEAEFERHQDT